MPNKKSGTAGEVQSPADPTEAQDCLDGQAGSIEDALAAGTDRGKQRITLSSVTSSAEQAADSSDAADGG